MAVNKDACVHGEAQWGGRGDTTRQWERQRHTERAPRLTSERPHRLHPSGCAGSAQEKLDGEEAREEARVEAREEARVAAREEARGEGRGERRLGRRLGRRGG